MKAPLASDEVQRLKTLRQYDVLDTPPEQSFDDLTLLAAHICQTPIALVSLVDEKRQWFKSKVGMSATEISRDIAFCAHTILHKDEVLEVRDAENDPRFAANPLVTSDPHIRFYAGSPLVAPDGNALGALCVLDRVPRTLTVDQLAALNALSRHVVAQLELRRQARELANEAAGRQHSEALLRKQFDQLSASKEESDRLLAIAQKSRRALLSVLEDEKQMQVELRWKTAFLEAQVDSALDGILVVNGGTKKILQNQRLFQLFKVPDHIINDDDHAKLLQYVTNQTKNPKQFGERVNYLYEHPDEIGRDEIVLIDGTILDRYSAPIRDKTGNYYGRIWAFRDITERKRSERRLATQSTISQALADSYTLNEATPKIMEAICESEGWDFGSIWEVDKKANLLRCLEVWHSPGLPAEELTVKTRELTFTMHAGLPGRVWASGKPLLVPYVTTDKNFPRAPFATKIGLNSALAFPIILEGEAIGVMDFLGREIREMSDETREMFLGIGRQIGSFFKRKKLEEQFRQSQKMEGIGQLAGGVAHDFNNILAVIQMQCDLLKDSDGLSTQPSEFADEIIATVQSAAALTRQLLLFSRREVFQPRDIDLNESIIATTKMLNRILGENIQMHLKLPSQPMFIHADAGMIDQVLLNLVVNARDAMPNGGQLVIETSPVEFDELAVAQSAQTRLGSFACLSVSDSGSGIPPEVLPNIFEPFFTTKDVGKGTGLGLATVFGIVQQHQGWLNVYSEVGHGTTFRIYLPRLAKNAILKSSSSALASMRGGSETILLVEDDPKLRLSVRKALSQLGYHILEAPIGAKALEVWKQNCDAIHLLLTDLVMPDGMNGKDLAQRILQENPKLKVIYMSGYSAEVVGKDFPLKEGVNFLTKPFQAQKLAQAIREKLDAKN